MFRGRGRGRGGGRGGKGLSPMVPVIADIPSNGINKMIILFKYLLVSSFFNDNDNILYVSMYLNNIVANYYFFSYNPRLIG